MTIADTLTELRTLALTHRLAYQDPQDEHERRTAPLNKETALALGRLADELEDLWTTENRA